MNTPKIRKEKSGSTYSIERGGSWEDELVRRAAGTLTKYKNNWSQKQNRRKQENKVLVQLLL